MLNVRVLIVNGVEIPVQASHRLNQSYTEIEAKSRRRFLSGRLWQRKTYSGLIATEITGEGIAPAGIQNLDTDNPIELSCVAPRAVNSASTSITIPSNRRADAGSEPFALAIVKEALVVTSITNIADIVAGTSDIAAVTAVVGANQYQVWYYPLLTVICDPLQDDMQRGGRIRWRLTAEEEQ